MVSPTAKPFSAAEKILFPHVLDQQAVAIRVRHERQTDAGRSGSGGLVRLSLLLNLVVGHLGLIQLAEFDRDLL